MNVPLSKLYPWIEFPLLCFIKIKNETKQAKSNIIRMYNPLVGSLANV